MLSNVLNILRKMKQKAKTLNTVTYVGRSSNLLGSSPRDNTFVRGHCR